MKLTVAKIMTGLLAMIFLFGSHLYACGSGCGCMGNLAPEIKAKIDAAKVVHGCPGSCMCDVGKNQPVGNTVTVPAV